jgi:glycosyltransferase involved in cell wall biosynthesis
MTKLTVAAVIPVFNGEPWILDALRSVMQQTYPVDQIVVVDDASTDRSADLASLPGVTVIRLGKNSGEGAARNAGIREARCDCVAMLDADDIWDPKHVEVLVSLLERHPEASVACAATQRFGLKSEVINGYVLPGEPRKVFWEAYDDWLHTTIGALFRRNALLSVGGFSEVQRYSVDYDLWLRLSCDHLFVSTHEITSYWRWHAQQQSQSYPAQLRAVNYYRYEFWKACKDGRRKIDAGQVAERFIELWLRQCASYRRNPEPRMRACLTSTARCLRPTSGRQVLRIGKALLGLLVVHRARSSPEAVH